MNLIFPVTKIVERMSEELNFTKTKGYLNQLHRRYSFIHLQKWNFSKWISVTLEQLPNLGNKDIFKVNNTNNNKKTPPLTRWRPIENQCHRKSLLLQLPLPLNMFLFAGGNFNEISLKQHPWEVLLLLKTLSIQRRCCSSYCRL